LADGAGTLPLAGSRVIEIGTGLAAPYCGRLLARYGADVIKVERPPFGDPLRRRGPFPPGREHPEHCSLFHALNSGKRSVTLDVTTPTGREILDELLASADVLVENLPAEEADALGFSGDGGRNGHPHLVHVPVTAYGRTGPYRTWQGTSLTASAMGGVSVGIGRPGDRPLTMPFALGAYQAGLAGAAAALLGLLARRRLGAGQEVDVAEIQVWGTIHTGANILTYLYLGVTGIRQGNRGIGLYPNEFLPCKDGFVCLTCTPLHHWIAFLECMGQPEWSANPRYRNRRAMLEEYPEEVDALLIPWLREHTRENLFAMARKKRFPLAPSMTVADTLASEHLGARKFFDELAIDGTRARVPGVPSRSGLRWHRCQPAPALGAHTAEVLGQELGRSPETLTQLRRAGIV
jgi:crotonobetainyl-CoA:carnitine CoA-transferase CaiB-like acyl-CoA transferase